MNVNDGLIAVLQVDIYGFGNPVKKEVFWDSRFWETKCRKEV